MFDGLKMHINEKKSQNLSQILTKYDLSELWCPKIAPFSTSHMRHYGWTMNMLQARDYKMLLEIRR